MIRDYRGDDYDSHSYYDVITLDLKAKETVNTSEFDRSGDRVVVNDDGAAIGPSLYVSKTVMGLDPALLNWKALK